MLSDKKVQNQYPSQASTKGPADHSPKAWRPWLVLGFVLGAAFLRLLPHPPNFTPIAAMALFAGSMMRRSPWVGVALPIAALFLSDLFIGFHETAWVVYLAMAIIGAFAIRWQPQSSAGRWATGTITGSLFFFVTTNFAVWLQTGMYEKSFAGLVSCFVAALPFLDNTVVGDFFFSASIFGIWKVLEMTWPQLQTSEADA